MRNFVHKLGALVGYGLVFSLIGGLTAYIYLNTRFVYEPCHLVRLDEEFTASRSLKNTDFEAYLKLEERLFQELHEKAYQTATASGETFNRYRSGSLSDPDGYSRNWNKSFEMKVENPRGGVLLLHGLTDSPYSVRSFAETLAAEGFWVVGLRLPGHGTIPSALIKVHWQDWAAASRLAARHLREVG